MKKILALLLTVLINSTDLSAAVFNQIPLETLINESSGAAEATLSSKRVFKRANGFIYTEYSFEVDDLYGLSETELADNQLKLVMMGGTLDGVTSFIDGAPEFKAGERSLLFLTKIKETFYLSNFTIGKYNIQTVDGETVYISTVFPYSPELGKIKKADLKEKFEQKKTIKKERSVKKDVNTIVRTGQTTRLPSSDEEVVIKSAKEVNNSLFYSLVFSGVCVVAFSVYRVSRKKK